MCICNDVCNGHVFTQCYARPVVSAGSSCPSFCSRPLPFRRPPSAVSSLETHSRPSVQQSPLSSLLPPQPIKTLQIRQPIRRHPQTRRNNSRQTTTKRERASERATRATHVARPTRYTQPHVAATVAPSRSSNPRATARSTAAARATYALANRTESDSTHHVGSTSRANATE